MQVLSDQQCIDRRVQEHAKLFVCDGRQVLAFLQRGDDDSLVVVLQAWVNGVDEQVRGVINFSQSRSDTVFTDMVAWAMFSNLTEAMVPQLMLEIGLTETIAQVENGDG